MSWEDVHFLFGENPTISEQQKRVGERGSGRGARVRRQGASVRSRWQCACVCFVLDCMCLCPFSLTLLHVTCALCVTVWFLCVWKVTCQGCQFGQHRAALLTLPPGDEDAPACHCRHGYCRKRGADIVCFVNSCVIGPTAALFFIYRNCGPIITKRTFKSSGSVLVITSQLFQSFLEFS